MPTATTADSVAEAERKLARMLRQMNGWAEMQRQGSTLTPKRAVLILDSQLKVKEST
jgi:hypothetical protein